MLKRLRLQFVAVIMVIVTIMLCTVFGMLYFFTRSSLEQESFAMMRAVPVGIMAPDRPLAPFARPVSLPTLRDALKSLHHPSPGLCKVLNG